MQNLPTYKEIYNAIIADFENEFNTTIPSFGKNFFRAIAAVQAAKLKLYYLRVAAVQKNIFIDTADPESKGGTLERFGRVKLNRNPFPATAGEYLVEVSGSIGATISQNTTFKSDDNSSAPGKLFILDNSFTFIAAVGSIVLRALETGVDSKLNINDTLTATAPIANVDSAATVLIEQTTPQPAENIEVYRAKALEAYRLEPQGGAAADFRLWASDVQGVANSYPFVNSGAPHEVNLFIEATPAESTDGNGTPTATIISNVESSIEDPTATRPARLPLPASVNYLAVSPLSVEIVINDFEGIDADKELIISNTIDAYLKKIRPFVGAIETASEKNDILTTNAIVSLILSAVPGSVFGAVTLSINGGAPIFSFTFSNGNIPFLDSINYV